MKIFNLIVLILILLFCTGASGPFVDIAVSYQPNVDKLEEFFKASLPLEKGVVYTKVPRGLILSIDEHYFFNTGETKIKKSSLCILNTIINLLRKIPNYCIVEDHTEDNIFYDSEINETWELSMVRSDNIIKYMSIYGGIPANQLFSLGYGEYMPFKDNVGPQKGMNNRIDFVIIEYEAKR